MPPEKVSDVLPGNSNVVSPKKVPEKSKILSPRKSIVEKVFGKSSSGSGSFKKRSESQSSMNEDEDGGVELMEIGGQRTKNVLILMSDTGGGHRASAEAIRDAFQIEFGDEYKVGTLITLMFLEVFLNLICSIPCFRSVIS